MVSASSWISLWPYLYLVFSALNSCIVATDLHTADFVLSLFPSANDVCEVTLTLRLVDENTSVHFVRSGTPFAQEEDWTNEHFFSDSGWFEYNGPIVEDFERVRSEDIISIEPGVSVSVVRDICSLYTFAQVDTYSIYSSFLLRYVDMNLLGIATIEELNNLEVYSSNVSQVQVESASTAFQVTDSPKVSEQVSDEPRTCDADQQAAIDASVEQALIAIEEALVELPGGFIYDKYNRDLLYWFGQNLDNEDFDDINIRDGFLKMRSALQLQEITFSCFGDRCGSRTYAYVYPSAFSRKIVYLCNSYFSAPASAFERDSKPGTIIHELSHFKDMSSTRDIAYGSPNIDQLVIIDNKKARQNADNWEAFAETYAFNDEERELALNGTRVIITFPTPAPSPLPTDAPKLSNFFDNLTRKDFVFAGLGLASLGGVLAVCFVLRRDTKRPSPPLFRNPNLALDSSPPNFAVDGTTNPMSAPNALVAPVPPPRRKKRSRFHIPSFHASRIENIESEGSSEDVLSSYEVKREDEDIEEGTRGENEEESDKPTTKEKKKTRRYFVKSLPAIIDPNLRFRTL
mmetsp:Transcript_8438/g.9683  ORF Transcript_8438/g.9683 Transcript_8438/m.9683 type:complete len:573 (-) Transcript_8438:39-1757(-)|eukprot:CAMPEP_0184014512 /NCGR_PEP_ID=MMETSP0954-20121128/5712_1 /TAXON_ID=627963 /ORGANISM="Aplanochytrium sp, Strain PBS07" /LENGTH=572 /DNA_ID=CAMNT_0026295025 /DNA_START=352 /DNA_END=2070 /DNA_ORIENTATION=-